ncbi:MAG: hypothetical protein INQ03_05005 [Candidatus Heimdallarchaeota archaeon]|nr:hypothetical protein [Candidatus Heimdallarchaeota archaeon]
MEIYLGEYSITRSGNALKVTVPKTVLDNWQISPGDKVHLYFNDDIFYVSKRQKHEVEDNLRIIKRDAVQEEIDRINKEKQDFEFFEKILDDVQEMEVKLESLIKKISESKSVQNLRECNKYLDNVVDDYNNFLSKAGVNRDLFKAEELNDMINDLYKQITDKTTKLSKL